LQLVFLLRSLLATVLQQCAAAVEQVAMPAAIGAQQAVRRHAVAGRYQVLAHSEEAQLPPMAIERRTLARSFRTQ
jgi:hypothetical protein